MIGLGNGGKDVRMLDDFKMGPNLVRGFQPAGIGPRDITLGTTNDNIGGTMYWGASLRSAISVLLPAQGFRLPRRRLRRFRFGVGLQGRDPVYPATGEINGTDHDRATAGVAYVCGNAGCNTPTRRPARLGRRQPDLGLAVRSAAVRFRLSDLEAVVRPDPILPVRRRTRF
jgi:hypothetical protein